VTTDADLEDRELCPSCGWICDDEDCECPDTCFTKNALALRPVLRLGSVAETMLTE
jgi:formylmethanofuran dehydrogenase subunit B